MIQHISFVSCVTYALAATLCTLFSEMQVVFIIIEAEVDSSLWMWVFEHGRCLDFHWSV